ncbi:hypothetical protein PsorP6_012646 [Peronosclerospora sorghi]|uniref:Uncharacterized protein n=1 Tax=Peronosclerospora sorghi TaxID=230839 RepID=A0ACC0WG07_9STRA|nr:hypothetical protein PsorP6_012646 [Peronosclerospora sorghi]
MRDQLPAASLPSAHTEVTETGQCGVAAALLVDDANIIYSDAQLQRNPRTVASMSDCEREASADVPGVQSHSSISRRVSLLQWGRTVATKEEAVQADGNTNTSREGREGTRSRAGQKGKQQLDCV